MRLTRTLAQGASALALAAAGAASAGATTLRRASVDHLTTHNSTVLVGTVLEATSRWNPGRTFIVTDVRIAADEVLKGRLAGSEMTVTLMGGSVDDLTALIVGGARLVPGRSYVLFVDQGDLPGLPDVPTLRDHCQGAFDVVEGADGLRAVSQAAGHALAPDVHGVVGAPGGTEGVSLDALKDAVRRSAGQGAGSRR